MKKLEGGWAHLLCVGRPVGIEHVRGAVVGDGRPEEEKEAVDCQQDAAEHYVCLPWG